MQVSDWIHIYNMEHRAACVVWREMIDSSPSTKRIEESYLRCSKLSLDSMVWSTMHEEIKKGFERYKESVPHNGNLNFCTHMEVLSILKYEPNGADHFHAHADNWNAESSLRQVSAIVFLNSVAAGGVVSFPKLHMAISPVEGSILFFPAFFPFLHLAETPLSEAKYSIVTWLCYPPATTHYRVSPMR